MTTKPFIFLHVPKTAGTTLRVIIERQYSPEQLFTVYEGADDHHSMQELKALSAEEKQAIQAYCGHVSFGVHREIGQGLKYVTLLRNPVERVISYYHHVMTLAPKWQKQPISLLKFVQGRKDIQVDNLQTRLLSGISKPFGQCSDAMLWTAIENIERHFEVVGTADLFDESLMLMANAMGWQQPYYVKENIGKGRPSADYYSTTELNVIRNHNRLDSLLYSYVQRGLNRQIKKAGDSFRNSVDNFRLANDESSQSLSARAVWSEA